MIRPATFVAMLVFVFAGLFLSQTKHRSQLLDREIAQTLKAADEARGRTNLLRAEYALLNDPSRLQDLSDQVLKLRPTAPTQFTTLADLPRRLPAIGPMPNTEPVPAAEPPTPASPIEPAAAAAPPPVVAAVKPPAPPKPVVAAKPVPAPTVLAAPRPAPAPVTQPVVLASAPAQPATTTEAIRQIARGGRVDTGNPVVASALGMARSMGGAPDMSAHAATKFEAGSRN